MTEKRERSWRNGLLSIAVTGCLMAAVLVQVDSCPAFLQVDYHERVREQLAQGEILEALDLLNRASLLDEEALESVGRVPFPSSLANDRKQDANLRAWIAEWIVAELGTGKALEPEEREVLMGDALGHTAPCWTTGAAKSGPMGYMDERLCLLGNG